MMPDTNNETNDNIYRVESVEPADAPEGMPKGIWHSYTIMRGQSKIEGLKPGSRFEVLRHAEEVVIGLNERIYKGTTAYVSSKRKK